MDIRVIREPIVLQLLQEVARSSHHMFAKGVVDIAREIIALGGEWHMDANAVLISDGSSQKDVWGFNVYPQERGDGAIEYISLINIRPGQGNKTMEVSDPALRAAMRTVIARLIPDLGL